MSTLKAVGNNVIIKDVQAFEPPKTTLIELPEDSHQGLCKGIATSYGSSVPTILREAIDNGHPLVFGKYAGRREELDGEQYTIIDADKILGYSTEDV